MKLNKKIFRGYDIRGIYPADLNESTAELIGKAVGSFFLKNNAKQVVVGQDNRLTSQSLTKSLISGLTWAGCDVVDIGITLTPIIYFATWGLNYKAAIIVTASHNPAKYNGFKVVLGKSVISGTRVLRLIDAGNFSQGTGSVWQKSVKEEYFEQILKGLNFSRSLKLVFDPGNGTASFFAPELYKRLGFEVIKIHSEPDGAYPNHPPDPQLTQNYGDMAELVVKNKADFGIALDGDADRFNFCDDKGKFADGDLLIAFFAKEVLKHNPGAKILVNVLISQGILDFIKKNGGQPVIWKVGHAFLKAKMLEVGAVFCGESGSGHLFFADKYLGFDDALYASLRLCEIVSNSGLLSELVSKIKKEIPKYFATPEVRVTCGDEIKFEVVEKVKNQLAKNFAVIDIDGVRFTTTQGWGIIRPSNTEPVLSIRAEGKRLKDLEEVKGIISQVLEKHAPFLNFAWG